MSSERCSETTAILGELANGDAEAVHRLMPLVYTELREIADRAFHKHNPINTLQPTALAHEAYVRLVDRSQANYECRAHFMNVAARAMRQILVDRARRRASEKRGGGRLRVAMHEAVAVTTDADVDVLDLHEALEELSRLDERKARVVELRFFVGLSIAETAAALSLARATVTEDWRMARAWLASRLGSKDGDDGAAPGP